MDVNASGVVKVECRIPRHGQILEPVNLVRRPDFHVCIHLTVLYSVHIPRQGHLGSPGHIQIEPLVQEILGIFQHRPVGIRNCMKPYPQLRIQHGMVRFGTHRLIIRHSYADVVVLAHKNDIHIDRPACGNCSVCGHSAAQRPMSARVEGLEFRAFLRYRDRPVYPCAVLIASGGVLLKKSRAVYHYAPFQGRAERLGRKHSTFPQRNRIFAGTIHPYVHPLEAKLRLRP